MQALKITLNKVKRMSQMRVNEIEGKDSIHED
jgi:hypothetical protein